MKRHSPDRSTVNGSERDSDALARYDQYVILGITIPFIIWLGYIGMGMIFTQRIPFGSSALTGPGAICLGISCLAAAASFTHSLLSSELIARVVHFHLP